jgi:hypothetical protein
MKIFVSYSGHDKPIVDRIVSELKEDKHDIWLDHLEIKPGDNIEAKIESGLRDADALVVVVSENSFKSPWVQREVAAIALQGISKRRRLIYPLRIDKSPIPSYLAEYVVLDLAEDFEAGMQRLKSALHRPPSKAVQEKQRSANSADNRAVQIASLRDALRSGRLTLVCGAGVSVGAGIPAWNKLLLQLLERMMKRISIAQSIPLDGKAAKEFQERNGSSAPILGKYLKNTLGNAFAEEVRDALYSSNPVTCPLIESIVALSRPRRDGQPLDSILTYNFDGLIEENLAKAKIPNKAIFSDAVSHSANVLPIYHVHGYLPRDGAIPIESAIVFAEDAYHTQFIDPFSWSNLIQLNKWTENVCLFIGISLTDPNMRRLLDVAWRKNPDKTLSHYIVKVVPKSPPGDVVAQVSRFLEEQDANGLGLNVIWVNDYDDIPAILTEIPPPD